MKTMLQHLRTWDGAKLAFFLSVLTSTVVVFALTPDLLPSMLISALLFFIFSPIVDSLERKGLSRTQAILAVFLLCSLLVTLTFTRIIPRISEEAAAFQKGTSITSSHITEKIQLQERQLLGGYPMLKDLRLTEKGLTLMKESMDRIWAIVPKVASQFLMCLFLVPFLTFVLLKDGNEIRRALLKLVPNRHFETVYALISRILEDMGGYVAARILEAVLVTLMVTTGCLVLKIPYAILLGVFAGVTNPIPYLGPLLGAVPGVLLAILEPASPNHLFLLTLVYLAANMVDMLVIFPLVVAKIVNLHPVLVVISVILGAQLFGIVGMIVAVPITSIVKILVGEVYSRLYDPHEMPR